MIKLAEDTISPAELADAADFLKSGKQLTKGPVTLQFEAVFSKTLEASYAVFVNSGSSANLLVAAALKESGQLRNLTVVCPAISWVTTVSPFMQLGFDVILCDSESESLGIDPVKLERIFVESSPSLLILVHVLGHANQMAEIQELCNKYGVLIVEDSCEALGSTYRDGRNLGTIGKAGTYSFYYGHHISTIEGGMVVTDDFNLYQLMLSMRSHGWSRDLDDNVRADLTSRYKIDEFRNLYTFYYPGFNFRSTDLQASIGLSQVKQIGSITEIRESRHHAYASHLTEYWGQASHTERLSSFAYGTAVSNRSEVSIALSEAGIESRPLICGNIGRHPFWLRHNSPQSLPVADWIHDHGMYLPIHAKLEEKDVAKVTQVFKEVATPSFL